MPSQRLFTHVDAEGGHLGDLVHCLFKAPDTVGIDSNTRIVADNIANSDEPVEASIITNLDLEFIEPHSVHLGGLLGRSTRRYHADNAAVAELLSAWRHARGNRFPMHPCQKVEQSKFDRAAGGTVVDDPTSFVLGVRV